MAAKWLASRKAHLRAARSERAYTMEIDEAILASGLLLHAQLNGGPILEGVPVKLGRHGHDEGSDSGSESFGTDSSDPSRRPSKLSWQGSVQGQMSYRDMRKRSSLLFAASAVSSRRGSLTSRRPSISILKRHNSVIQARRQSLAAGVLDFPEELSINPASAGGHLFDFIVRSRRRPLYSYDIFAQELSELCAGDHFLEYNADHKHAHAMKVMLKEALYCTIEKFLAPELKSCSGAACWPPAERGLLRKMAKLVVRNSREAKCLDAEVKKWRRRYGSGKKEASNQEPPRAKFQKQEKVVGLWLDYHGRVWNTDEDANPPPKPKLRALHSSTSLSRLPSCGNLEDALSPGLSQSGFSRSLSRTFLPPLHEGGGAWGHSLSDRMASPPATSMKRSATAERLKSLSKGGTVGGGGRLPAVASRVKYLNACDGQFIPKTLDFVTGHSTKLEAAGRNLLDHDLIAMVQTLPVTTVESVDLCDNRSLSDKSLVPFLEGIVKNQAKKLRRLSLRQCTRASLGSQGVVLEVLQVIENLRFLDISCIHVALKYHWPLCEAIREHAYLETAVLSDIGLGHSPKTKDCAAALAMSKLKVLDIGWNCFNGEEFLCFAERLRDNDWIQELSLPNSAAKFEGQESPISFFLEHLSYVKPLRHLDISYNGIDYQSALVLEDALERHAKLTSIDLSGNALGFLGVRSFLRLMSQSHCGLLHFDAKESFHGVAPIGEMVQIFRSTNPSGRYDFDLARPYHRSFLRMLYKSCERFSISPEQAFQGVTYSLGGYKHPAKDREGVRQVPTEGTISFTFNIERGIEAATQGVKDEDFQGFLRRHYERTRFCISFDKLLPILACWRGLGGMHSVQVTFLRALAVDFSLTLPQIEALCESCKSRGDDIISMLLPCLAEEKSQRCLAMLIFDSCSLYLSSEPRTRTLRDLNIDNPTGHYDLDLGNSCDFAVAQHLLLLDRWEVLVDGRKKRFDISSRGNRSHLRNEQYRGIPLLTVCETIAQWTLPESDNFQFDYVSSARPAPSAEVLSSKNFDLVLTELSDCTAPPECRLAVLRSLSSYFYLSSFQMRQMLGVFRTKQERAEAFVIFYLRIVDMCNSKAFRVRFGSRYGSSEEKEKLVKRLGYAAFFPFIQPENERFDLDLTFHDQRICCMLLVSLSLQEKAGNIREPRYILANGMEDPLTQGVPRSWAEFEKVPTSGVFSCSYVCSPDDRQFDLRKKLGQTYGYIKTTQTESQVLWWTGLSEAPHDVICLLEFLIGRTSSADKAFTMLDFEGTGTITFRSLADVLDNLGCKKFDGEDKYDRIEIVFRYLDPGMEGSITKNEWGVVKQLWNEFEHTICEFAQFLVRAFGEDFSEAWEALHEELELDPDSTIEQAQFMNGVEELGYFGTTDVVFHMMDKDDNGSISEDEFLLLNRYKKLPNLTRKAMSRPNTRGRFDSS